MRNFYLGIKLVLPTILLLVVGLGGIKASNTECAPTFFAAPIATDDVFSTDMAVPMSGDLLTNDVDPDGGDLSVTPMPFPPPANGSIFISTDGVFSYTPNPDFTGVDQFGYSVCNSNNECVNATATIYVWPAGCSPAEKVYSDSSCSDCTSICMDIPLMDIENNYAVTQNGGTYNGGFTGCDFETSQAYPYASLAGQGDDGPYELLSWDVDGTVYTGTFNNPQELADLMNANNPAGEWFLNNSQMLIFGGSNLSTYSDMTVENSATPGSNSVLAPNTQTIALGTIVCLAPGTHELAFNPLDGSCPEDIATITIDCVMTSPLVTDDSYTTMEGTAISDNVLNNDSDPLGVGLTVSLPLVSLPLNGTVNQNADGTFTYTPNASFTGTDSYTYEACNNSTCEEATVTITIGISNSTPIAVDDAYTIDEGTVYMNNVFINDTEPDGNPIIITIITFPSNGALQLSSVGNLTYTPTAGFTGSDSFIYELCDDAGLCDQATVTFTVQGINAPPVAMDDIYNIPVGETLDGNIINNDTDPEGGALTLTTIPISGPQMGIVTLNANGNGTFSYMSPPAFIGTDQFTYEVCDAVGNCSQAIVTINITTANNPPVATDDNYTTSVDSPIMNDVTTNDTDEDIASVTISIQNQPTNGAISMNSDGTFSYMPLAGYVGTDQFIYEICDNAGLCAQATAFITVETACNNDVETYDSEICDSCVYICIDIPAGDINDYDITVDGLAYTGNMLACDMDTFIAYTYFTLLGGGDQGPYELLSWVIDGVPYTGLFDNPTELVSLMNTIDPAGNWQLNGQIPIISGGNPSSNYSVMDVQNLDLVFSFSEIGFNEGTVANGTAICIEQGFHVVEVTLTGEACPSLEINTNINCQGNLSPVAEDDFYTTDMNANIGDNVTINDSDPNGDFISVNTTLVSEPSNGIAVIGSTGVFNYIPSPGFVGMDMFTYEICDASGLCDEAVVTITILPQGCVLAEIDNISAVDASSCGTTDGSIGISLVTDIADYTFGWTAGIGTVSSDGSQLSGLPQGTYSVTITHISDPGCFIVQDDIVIANIAGCRDTISIQIPQSEPFDTCLTAWYDLPGTLTSAGVCLDDPNTVLVAVNQTDACISLDPEDMFEGTDTLCVYHCNELGFCDTTIIVVEVLAPDCMNDFLGLNENTFIEADSCGGVAQFCLPIPFGSFQNYSVSDNGTAIPSGVAGCDIEGTIFYTYISLIGDGELGPYYLDSWTVGGSTFSGEFLNISELVDSMNLWDPAGEWTLDASTELIAGVGDGSLYGNMEITHILTNGPYTVGFNIGEYANSSYIELGMGMHELIVIENATGCTDTVLVEVYCLASDTLYNTIVINSNDTTCFSIATTLPGNVDLASLGNICMINSGTEVMFDPATEDGTEICVSYSGLAVGTDSACITICDDLGICETTMIIVEVIPDGLLDVIDTLYVGDTEVVCPQDFAYSGTFDTLTNICPESAGESVIFDLDPATGCIMYTGLEMGTDTACIVYCDTLAGICDTAYIYVHVLDTTTNIAPMAINDTETVSSGTAAIIDVLGNDTLYGELQTLIVIGEPNHGLADVQGNSVILYTPEGDFCGQDTFSYIICNETDCDTAIVVMDVNCMAVDDMGTTMQGAAVLIDVIDNDSLDGALQSLVITGNPDHGTVIVLGETVVLYTPTEGFCGQDSFVYTVCNETVCDMAIVVVEVECSDFEIHTAVSPNGDGVNDVFTINGIAQFETVSLIIFNRWGSKVFEMNNERYSNTAGEGGKGPWDGTWNGMDLPDGTYFYHLELPNGLGLKSGYIQLRR